ncbi:type II toxin-antitoxin system RelE/ParE family toxin [Mesorhizobium sp. M6A.T.Ce.TU.016.01.1.1]|uniref:type II toxin-antitoxin system RelE/ParE family toxin n=1 Tax=Mesorhizobium sp. M6A.T.Ce.TU.016.01.1.1 TaxID=2496783 RepID=UPI0032AF3CFF
MIQRLEVEYRETARNDLADIFRNIVEAGGNPDVALKFVLRIEDRCQSIGNAPRGGRSRDDRSSTPRSLLTLSATISFASSTSSMVVATTRC